MYQRALVFLAVFIFVAPAYSQTDDAADKLSSGVVLYGERVELSEILDAVQRNSKKSFLVNHQVPRALTIGNVNVRDITYAMLLQVLRNNDLAAVTVSGIVNIIPVGFVRQYPLPDMPANNNSLTDEEWVTGVISVENAPAPTFIPMMRPMMPRAGHLAANAASDSIIIVDRLGNARRIAALIRKLDQATPPNSD